MEDTKVENKENQPSQEKGMSKEYCAYEVFLNEIEDKNLKRRAELSLKYYINKAVRYKRLWCGFSIAGIVLPAIATFIASLNASLKEVDLSNVIILITACTTVVTGLMALFKCADKKTSYRNSAENLKSELCAYASNNGAYSEDPAKKDEIFFKRLESIIKEGYEKIEALENNKATAEKQN